MRRIACLSSIVARSALAGALSLATLAPAQAARLCTRTTGSNGMSCTTSRMEVVFVDGAVVRVKDLASGEVHANNAPSDVSLYRGLGHFTGDTSGAGCLHGVWSGSTSGPESQFFHHPYAGSSFQFSSSNNNAYAIWTGLHNGSTSFPTQTLRIDVGTGNTGELVFRATATSPGAPGAFGVIVPILNLTLQHRIFVPSFGGVFYDATMANGISTLHRAPFLEAPVVAAESPTGAVGLWIADPGFKPHMFALSKTSTSFAIGLEQFNPLPQDALTSMASVDWHLDVFSGNWVAAMTPYKNWYAQQFATELGRRAASPWAGDIEVIMDAHMAPGDPEGDASLAYIRNLFGDGKVLYHEWDARLASFDTELPDFTPKPIYPDRNRALRALGFRTMGYVNSYVVNFQSPAFVAANMINTTLPHRYDSIWSYCTYVGLPPSYQTATPGQLVYLDPLAQAWRDDHVSRMATWNAQTEFDANYEDTAGVAGDFGNGTVGGLTGAKGSVAEFQALQLSPGVPMASEYGTDAIAFASRWPLRFQQAWGDVAFRTWLMTHQRPVSSFLFGPDQAGWVPTIVARDNFHRQLVTACSDALGGVAQFHGDRFAYRATRGDLGHQRSRAVLFASLGLKPAFDTVRGPDSLAAWYRDRNNVIYQYHVDANEQKLVGPGNAVLWSRITGLTSKTTSLSLPGWPAVWNGTVFGLEPQVRYALSSTVAPPSDIQLTSLTPSVKVARYYENPGHDVLVLSALNGQGTPTSANVTLFTNVPTLRAIVNDALGTNPVWNPALGHSDPVSYTVSLPARFVFVKQAGSSPAMNVDFASPSDVGHFIEKETGIDRGGEVVGNVPFGQAAIKVAQNPDVWLPAFLPGWGENSPHTFDWLVNVPSADAFVQLYTCGNGPPSEAVIYVNAQEVARKTAIQGCNFGNGLPPEIVSIRVGQYAGREILVSVAYDNGPDNDANADLRVFSSPRFVGVVPVEEGP